jgi:hypothetical protein
VQFSTDLFDLAKNKAKPTSIAITPSGNAFAVTASDCYIRVFGFAKGKLKRKYDERPRIFEAAQREGTLKIDTIDFGRRMAFEKELQVRWPFRAPSRAVIHTHTHTLSLLLSMPLPPSLSLSYSLSLSLSSPSRLVALLIPLGRCHPLACLRASHVSRVSLFVSHCAV